LNGGRRKSCYLRYFDKKEVRENQLQLSVFSVISFANGVVIGNFIFPLLRPVGVRSVLVVACEMRETLVDTDR
jgi:hypothetical protein